MYDSFGIKSQIKRIFQQTYFHWIVYLWLYLIRILNHTSMEGLSLLPPQGSKPQMQCIDKFQRLEIPPYCKEIPYISMKRSFQVSSMTLHIWFKNIVNLTLMLFNVYGQVYSFSLLWKCLIPATVDRKTTTTRMDLLSVLEKARSKQTRVIAKIAKSSKTPAIEYCGSLGYYKNDS